MRVLLAISHPLLRALAERALRETPAIQVEGVARDVTHAAALIQALRPRLVLCSDDLYPALADHVTSGKAPAGARLVLLVSRGQFTTGGLPPGVSALLPADLPPAELAAYLLTMIDTREGDSAPTPRAPAPVAPARPAGGEAPPRVAPPRAPAGALRAPDMSHTWRPGEAPAGAAQRFRAGREQRRASPAEQDAYLRVAEEHAAYAPDPVTGLLTAAGLESAAWEVQELAYPVGVVVCACAFARGSVVPTDLTTHNDILRRIGATIRRAVREYDQVGLVEGLTFAVLLPGAYRSNLAAVGDRLAAAIIALDLTMLAFGSRLDVVLGIAGWEPGEPPADILDLGLRATWRRAR